MSTLAREINNMHVPGCLKLFFDNFNNVWLANMELIFPNIPAP